jgi:protein-ribulosamine 3-kinase
MRYFEHFIQQLEAKNIFPVLRPYCVDTISGGDINRAYHLQTPSLSWFIKLNQPHLLSMFQAEAAGLKELIHSQTVRVPQVIACDRTEDYAYLILEYLKLKSTTAVSENLFAQQLARLHQQHQAFYGWHQENTIGITPQINQRTNSWLSFWQQQRLIPQLKRAANSGYLGKLQRQGEKLCAELKVFLDNDTLHPSLLHGDLWSGNVAANALNQPVIFDPACYYGDREADIAMTELFGGFSRNFYAAYQEIYPLDSGYSVRKTLYNLYHVLNHLNIFGGSYLHRAESMLAFLLAEVS